MLCHQFPKPRFAALACWKDANFFQIDLRHFMSKEKQFVDHFGNCMSLKTSVVLANSP